MSDQTPETTRPPIAAAIITQNGRVLMVRRRVSEGSLSWQFPAGEVEPGESSVEAAAREAHEETGVTASDGTLLGERVHPKTGRTMVYAAFNQVTGEASVVDDEELDAFEWVSHSQLPEYVPYGLFEPVQEYLDTELRR
ncbi:NUDIX hydrolase [Saccharothrix australiensis]|uniref:ADP-ribose pyrophosphatase YjhB (NUDIX family) n=1 Tax=Saccharothrix australiensis TaxID=2072 RepID=A0A495VXT0_9PSEU|nr:NUDIX hydrolase [Saccharothrix australiensis]RKT52428.1 ADP-ribose pyrophosphatase YjhB (NUDIX family) [Saccharothrix australiensis]